MLNKSLFKKILLTIAAVNLLSFLAYNSPTLNWLCFILILTAAAVLAWRNLFYGLLILLGELMISSQGHLFDLWLGNFRFSLRIGLFVTLLTILFVQFLISNFTMPCRHDMEFLIKFQYPISNIQYLIKHYKHYLLLAIFIIFGIVNGLLNHNNLNFLYQDVNGYLFFLLLPIFALSFKKKITMKQCNNETMILTIWAAAIAWQFIAAVTLLFFYSHLDVFWRGLVPIYGWFRDQRLIEVGLYKYNFYRVFMQSGVWALTGFFVFINLWLFKSKKNVILLKCYIVKMLNKLRLIKKKDNNRTIEQFNNDYSAQQTSSLYLILIAVITILIISLSRSFWLAGFLTFIAFIIFYLCKERPKLKTLLRQSINLATILTASLAIIAFVLLIPIGKIPGLKSLTALSDRTMTTEDPAIASRWDLLPALWQKIQPDFLLGRGFGATVTYKTSDPRYLTAHPDNPHYTAFAFEWGWMDIWYKIGLLGLLTYLLLIGNILKRGWKIIQNLKLKINHQEETFLKYQYCLSVGLFFGLIALMIVHFFTPFLNHPLGIGYLLLTDAVFRTANKN